MSDVAVTLSSEGGGHVVEVLFEVCPQHLSQQRPRPQNSSNCSQLLGG